MYARRGLSCGKTSWVLHHDNVPSHSSLLVGQHLATQEMAVLLHPPYSRFAPQNVFLFLKLKIMLKGCHFQSVDKIKQTSLRQLHLFSEKELQGECQPWQKRWEHCVASRGNTLKGTYMHNIIMVMTQSYSRHFKFVKS